MTARPNTLVLYADYAKSLSYFDDWLEAFRAAPDFAVAAENVCDRGARTRVARRLGEFELIVLLHSTNADTLIYLEPWRGLLKERRGKLLSFVGNEFNAPGTPLAPRIAFLREVGADVIATQLLQETGEWLYADAPRARVVSVPHALNPGAFRSTTPSERRPIDIGTRSARYVAYLGDDDRNRLFELFRRRDFAPDLVVDMSTDERFDRAGWCGFLNRCKGTVATEAGSWHLERDDRTMNAIRAWVMEGQRARGGLVIANDSPLRRLGHLLPPGAKALLRRMLKGSLVRHEMLVNEELDFAEVYERFYRHAERPPVYGKAVSSRHFDAIGTETCQILLEGRYNDILRPGEHYIALSQDFSNLDDAVAEFRDAGRRTAIARRAAEFALDAHTHRHRIAAIRALFP